MKDEWNKAYKSNETCKRKCRLDVSVCNNKQRWNEDKYSCEYKELIDKGACDKEFIWNPSNCEYECDKLCDFGEYLDYSVSKCRKKLVDKLVEECTENIEETRLVKKTSAENENKHKSSSCTLYNALFSIIFTRKHWNWYLLCFFSLVLKKDIPRVKFNTNAQTTI